MNYNDSLDFRRAARALFYIVVFLAFFNHILRATTGSANTPATFGQGITGGPGRAFAMLNDVRMRTGSLVQSFAHVCPDQIEPYCADIMYGVRYSMGWH